MKLLFDQNGKSVSPYSAHQYGETQEKIMGRKIKILGGQINEKIT